MFLRKYGTGTGADVYIPIIKRAVVDFAVSADWTPAAGDVKISIDGGAAANIGTLPVAVAMGNGAYWKFVFSDAELTGKKMIVTVADSATKAVEDQAFLVETFGHASALYPTDYTVANVAQTGDNYARLGAPAGDSVSADVAAVKAETASILTDTAEIGAAGAGLTALGDTRLANLDAAVSSRSTLTAQGVWDALTSALTTAGSIGKLLVDNINATISSRSSHSAADVWSSVTRTLTTAVSGVTVPDGAAIIIRQGDRWSHTFTGLTTTGWTKLVLTVKRQKSDTDAESLFQIVLENPGAATDGLKYLNGAAATKTQGSLTLDSATQATAVLKSAATAALPICLENLVYDLKVIVTDDDDATTQQESTATITGAVTRAVS